MRQLPKEELIYVGDTKRCPYGTRSKEEVRKFTWEMVDFLLTKNIKTLVVACNTATAFTLVDLQEELTIPVIGVIQPGARAAIKSTVTNEVGVIGTDATIRSHAYEYALKSIKTDIEIESLACPMFVPMIEKGILSGEQADDIIEDSLQLMKGNLQMDTLDRKSTRLNSSHVAISYAVFCLK